jgi:hypothetical protein
VTEKTTDWTRCPRCGAAATVLCECTVCPACRHESHVGRACAVPYRVVWGDRRGERGTCTCDGLTPRVAVEQKAR